MDAFSAAASSMSIPWAALVPALIVLIGFVAYCIADLIRHPDVRYLPRWAWGLLCLASMPFGGIAYLIFGRSENR
jgi:hypothetical protein